MIIYLIRLILLMVLFHFAANFISRKLGTQNPYPGLSQRLERGECVPVALIKYLSDPYIWALKVVFLLALSMAGVGSSEKSYWQMEAEKEQRAQQLVDNYGGKLSDYL